MDDMKLKVIGALNVSLTGLQEANKYLDMLVDSKSVALTSEDIEKVYFYTNGISLYRRTLLKRVQVMEKIAQILREEEKSHKPINK